MAKIQARWEWQEHSLVLSLGYPHSPLTPGLIPCLLTRDAKVWRGSSWGWVQEQSWMLLICFMGGLQMCQSKGKSLSKLPCRIRHIHLHLPAHGLCSGTCPVSGGGRVGEPGPLQKLSCSTTGWVCVLERGRECVFVCVLVISSQPCPDVASSWCRSQMRAAQPLLTGWAGRKD